MRSRFIGILCILGLSHSLIVSEAVAQAPPSPPSPTCAARYPTAFARLQQLAGLPLEPGRVYAEVATTFAALGSRPDVCEPGGYAVFINTFREFAREAMRAPVRQREALCRIAAAAAIHGPSRVPADEARGAISLFHQTRSDLSATADDVGVSATLRAVLDAFERSGPPVAAPPPVSSAQPPSYAPPVTATPPSYAPPVQQVQTVRIPSTPLSAQSVIYLYEARGALRARDIAGAQQRLEAVLRALESAP